MIQADTLNLGIQHSDILQTGIQQTSSSAEILETHKLQTDISNLGIKHTEMLHTHNRHTVVEYTDI